MISCLHVHNVQYNITISLNSALLKARLHFAVTCLNLPREPFLRDHSYRRNIATDVARSVVCVSVCVCVGHTGELCKKRLNLGAHSCGSKESYVRPKWGPDPPWEGALWRGTCAGQLERTLSGTGFAIFPTVVKCQQNNELNEGVSCQLVAVSRHKIGCYGNVP